MDTTTLQTNQEATYTTKSGSGHTSFRVVIKELHSDLITKSVYAATVARVDSPTTIFRASITKLS